MAQTAITLTQLQNASADAQTLEVVINGDENTDVTTRLGNTYPTLDKALKLIMQHGLVGSTPYKTYQDLVNAHIPVNTYAVVTNDSDASKNGLYLNDDGTLKYSELNTVPQIMIEINKTLSNDQNFTDPQGRAVAWGVVDNEDKLGAWIAEDGTINASNIYTDDLDVAWAVIDDDDRASLLVSKTGDVSFNKLRFSNDTGYPLAFVDDNDRLAFAIDKRGNFINMNFETLKQSIKDLFNRFNANIPKQLTPLNKTDYMHVISYGQSLSRGSQAFIPINTTQPYQNVMFKTGVLIRDWEGADYTAFAPLIEADNMKGEAESPVSGTLNTFVAKQIASGGTADKWKMLGSAPGEGGRSVEYLSKGGGRYADLLKQVRGAMATANAHNQSYSVWAIAWTQAEQDYEEFTSEYIYRQRLIDLHDDLQSDIVAITKQSFAPIFICYQVASHRYYKRLRNDLALALLDASHARDDIMIACAMYQFTYAPDSLHLTAESSQMLGHYYANVLDYVYKTGKKWLPLEPNNILVQGKIIDIEFTKSNLVIDTTLVTQTANYGFDIWQGDVLQNIIASVAIVDKSRVRIVLNATLPENAILTYARGRDGDPYKSGNTEGARGNLRDSAGDIDNYTDRVGKKYMHNWCVAFESKLN